MTRRGLRLSFFMAADLSGIVAGFYLAFALRTLLNPVFVEQVRFSLVSEVFLPLYLTAFIWILAFRQLGLYSRGSELLAARTFVQVVKGSALVFGVLGVASFFTFREAYSRSLLLLLFPSGVATITACRMGAIALLRGLSRQGYGIERVAIVSRNDSVRRLVAKLRRQPGVTLCGIIGVDEPGVPDIDLPYLGALGEVAELIEKYQMTRLLCEDRVLSREQLVRLAEICDARGASLEVVPDFFQFVPHRMQLTDLGGIPLVGVQSFALSRWDLSVKRLLDILLAGAGLAVLWPVFLVLTVLIALESPGGVFYRQIRIGKDGRRFTLLKFRSMAEGADRWRDELSPLNEREGVLFKIRKDPRVTRVGRVIRRYSLDELPQLVNILRGDMSLVGPRPLPAEDLQHVDMARYGYWFEQRLRVRPGLTGLWQVSGRSELSFEEMVELDIFYMENRSLSLEFEIMLKTVSEVFRGRGAH